MGCAASSVDNEEKVLVCRQRKRLMKKLLGFRGEFADAQLAYLRALRNTGVTLRQFTESESLDLDNILSSGLTLPLPPSPPPTLPPSPPPPPPFSPDSRNPDNEESGAAPLPNSCNIWNPFESLEPHTHPNGETVTELKQKEQVVQGEEEHWAETKSEFEEEDCLDLSVQQIEADPMKKALRLKLKMSEDLGANRTTLEGIIRELDDYFLKASGCEKEIAVMLDIKSRDTIDPFRYQETTSK